MQIGRAHSIVRHIQLLQQRFERRVRRQSREARVTSSSIAVPEVNQNALERLASRHVKHTHIQPQRNTGLVFRHILTQSLRLRPPIRTLCHFGGKNAGLVLDGLVMRYFRGDLEGRVAAAGTLGEVPLPALLVEPGYLVRALGR